MSDIILRATAAGASLRVFVADTREMVNEAYVRHHTSPVVTAALGRLVTAGAIMSATSKNEKDLLTLKIEGDGPLSSLTVTCDSNGNVKGYPSNAIVDIPLKENGKLDVSGAIGNGSFTVIRDMGLKEPYVGTTELVSGEIAEDITYYYTVSEQIPSSMGLGVLVDVDYSVRQAGGFLIQLMPNTPEEVITKLEENLGSIKSVTSLLEAGNSPEDILKLLTEGLDYEITDSFVPHFKCNCSKEKVRRALMSLRRSELEEMTDDNEPINVHCDFCNTDYSFDAEEMREIIDQSC